MGSFPSKFGRNQVPVDPTLPLNSVDSTRLFESIDVNRNGSIEKDEFTAALLALGGLTHSGIIGAFEKLDQNIDGRISRQEFLTAFSNFPEETVRMSASIGRTSTLVVPKITFDGTTPKSSNSEWSKIDKINGAGDLLVETVGNQHIVVGNFKMSENDIKDVTKDGRQTYSKTMAMTPLQFFAEDAIRDTKAVTLLVRVLHPEPNVKIKARAKVSALWTSLIQPGARVRLMPPSGKHLRCGRVVAHEDFSTPIKIVTEHGEALELSYERGAMATSASADQERALLSRHVAVTLPGEDGSIMTAVAEFQAPSQAFIAGQRVLFILPEGGPLREATVCEAAEPTESMAESSAKGDATSSSPPLTLLDLAEGGQISVQLSDPYNHCLQSFPTIDDYRKAIASFCSQLADETRELEDGITGTKLKTAEQTVDINLSALGVIAEGFSDIETMTGLATPLLAPSPERARGFHCTQPVLVCAGAGTGKTWSSQQLAHLMAKTAAPLALTADVPLVPVLVYVQRLARILQEQPEGTDMKSSIVLQYYAREYSIADGQRCEWLMMLAQALQMRTLVIILDGIDEAAGRRDVVARFVRHVLVPEGFRVVCTSRPEGVRVDEFASRFVIFDLKPLSQELQTKMIEYQLRLLPAGLDFFNHVMAFTQIRTGHDDVYHDQFSEMERQQIEEFTARDRFFLNGMNGKRDPAMRLKGPDGSYANIADSDNCVRSRYLRGLCAVLTPAVLIRIDELLGDDGPADAGAMREEVGNLLPEEYVEIGFRLAMLTRKRRRVLSIQPPSDSQRRQWHDALMSAAPHTNALHLWSCICSRTDSIYEVNEDLLPVFEKALRVLTANLGISEKAINFAPGLKDPVRVHEKAMDDYVLYFEDADSVVAEACVLDMIRARIVCPRSREMVALLSMLRDGSMEVEIEAGQTATLEMMRCKNTFTDGGKKAPTRFRNANACLLLKYCGRMTFCEVQVHHEQILAFNNKNHAHDHYEFFRSLLASSYDHELDKTLEKMVLFLQEASGVPVLLSMLVLVFKHRKQGDTTPLPTSVLGLYQMAIAGAVTASVDAEVQDACFSMLTELARANMKAQRREFTSKDATKAFAGNTVLCDLWDQLTREGDAPLVKTLVNDTVLSGQKCGVYQFKHLSFQEALMAQALVATLSSGDHELMGTYTWHSDVRDPFNQNMLRIGGGVLGRQIAKFQHVWAFHSMNPGTATTVIAMLAGNDLLEVLSLGGDQNVKRTHKFMLGPEGCTAIANACEIDGTMARLKSLLIQGNGIGEAGITILAKLFAKGALSQLKRLDLNSNKMGDAGLEVLAKTLAEGALAELETLDLADNEIGPKGVEALTKSLGDNALVKLTTFSLEGNQMSDIGLEALADSFAEGRLAQLQTLNLGMNGFSVAGAKALTKSCAAGALRKIKDLHIKFKIESTVTEERVMKALRDALPSACKCNGVLCKN